MSTLTAAHIHPLSVLHTKHFPLVDAVRTLLHPAASSERFRYPPSLNSFLEDAAMAREMLRL